MRFDPGETYAEKIARLKQWHRWFAWYPVRVMPHDYRWLEIVERRGEWSCTNTCGVEWTWYYRGKK